jgi:hypothetical protein
VRTYFHNSKPSRPSAADDEKAKVFVFDDIFAEVAHIFLRLRHQVSLLQGNQKIAMYVKTLERKVQQQPKASVQ